MSSPESCILEGFSSVSSVINNMLSRNSNSPRTVSEVWFDMSKLDKYDRQAYGRYQFLKNNSQLCNYSFIELERADFEALVSGNTHGGIAAKCILNEISELSDADILPDGFYCYLDGIDDAYNLGYIIRTFYPFGISGIILPPNNKMKLFPSTVIKSSAGLTESVNLYTASPESLCELFHAAGYRIACAAIRDAVPCSQADFSRPLLLVIGGEKRGISSKILNESDMNVCIEYSVPFRGSLPSVCAAAILAYEATKTK